MDNDGLFYSIILSFPFLDSSMPTSSEWAMMLLMQVSLPAENGKT